MTQTLEQNGYEIPPGVDLWIDYDNGSEGSADHLPNINEIGIDIYAMEIRSLEHPDGMDRVVKQVLLEEIGQAWIRRAMPVAEIDWLP